MIRYDPYTHMMQIEQMHCHFKELREIRTSEKVQELMDRQIVLANEMLKNAHLFLRETIQISTLNEHQTNLYQAYCAAGMKLNELKK